jgi:heme A synthase
MMTQITQKQTTQKQKIFFWLAALCSLCTLALIALGGYVHNTGASLACPDWPLCFGQVLPKMEGIVAIEHSHRLLASFVGLLCIAMLWLARSFRQANSAVYKMSIYALLAVILQGILGGVTVLMKISPLVSTLHLALSQIFFAMILYLWIKSRPQGYPELQASPRPSSKALKILGLATVLLYLQILIGAAIRHTGAGAACGLGPAYSLLCMDAYTGGVTLWPDQTPSQFHVFHRYFGIIMVGIIVWATLPLLKWARAHKLGHVRVLGIASHAIVLIQVLLGILTVWTYIGTAATTLHLVFAGLLFACFVGLNILSREAKQNV